MSTNHVMRVSEAQRYFLLDGRPGGALSRWRAGNKAPPAEFGGLPGKRSVRACDGTLYTIDGDRILRTLPCTHINAGAIAVDIQSGAQQGKRLVYVELESRVEVWPAQTDAPADRRAVQVICTTAWDAAIARRAVRRFAGDDAQTSSPVPVAYPDAWLAPDLHTTTPKPLPGIGPIGSAPRQLRNPRALALWRDCLLYIADTGNDRVQVLDLRTLALRAVWGGVGGSGPRLSRPSDAAVTASGKVFIADTGNHVVRRFNPKNGSFRTIRGTTLAAHLFFVNYGDRARHRFVYVPALRTVELWPRELGRRATDVSERVIIARNVAGIAEARALILAHIGLSGATDALSEWCEAYPQALGSGEAAAAPLVEPAGVAVDGELLYVFDQGSNDVRVLDLEGRVVDRIASAAGIFSPATASATAATFISERFDSGIDRCTWHKLLIQLSNEQARDPGVTVWTFTTDDENVTQADVQSTDITWSTGVASGPDVLIRSQPGRYLWLKLESAATSANPSRIDRIKVLFPRPTLLQYLPAVYQVDAASRDFVDRFLSIFEAGFSEFESLIEGLWQMLDPRAARDDFIPWLGGWIAMTFDPAWPVPRRRELLRRSAELYRKRGTAAGLALMVDLALGLDIRIEESFRRRRWVLLDAGTILGQRSTLFGACSANRLQLGVNDQLSGPQLMDAGDPATDVFDLDAHRFTVHVNGPLSAAMERALRQLLDQEKPAHTLYTLCVTPGRFRVGVEATVGMDTRVGVYPRARLGGAESSALGYDTVLACPSSVPHPAAANVGEGSVVGAGMAVG